MADHVEGPLYYERMGRTGPVMAFVHPNPMDQSCWIFQMAHLSTWYRCIAIDIPGYGRSPKATTGPDHGRHGAGVLGGDRRCAPGERAILVGCSVGSAIAPYMHHQRPRARPQRWCFRAPATILARSYAPKRIAGYTAARHRVSLGLSRSRI